ncbi:MAG: YkgJ family cysteine cluster protein [Myxococcota bacterium]
MSAPIYMAFRSGGLHYDCRPCGRCCKGGGIGEDRDRLKADSTLLPMAPFVDSTTTQTPLIHFFTYADGCRHLNHDNLCNLHAEGGSAAKPRICRLFPFSHMVDIDGLWAILPHPTCPWVANPSDDPSPLSNHEAIRQELTPLLDAGIRPIPLRPLTPVPTQQRWELESRIRDATSNPNVSTQSALEAMHDIQGDILGRPPWSPSPLLWLDMLRCAGEPQPLDRATEELFVAALPTLRLTLLPSLPLHAIPGALAAFHLWLGATAELSRPTLRGDDLLHVLRGATPLLYALALAEQPLPELPPQPPTNFPLLATIWEQLQAAVEQPFGETVLRLLQAYDVGALTLTAKLGATFLEQARTIDTPNALH